MHALCLINPAVCPPDGFRYVDPIDGYIDHAWDHNTWVEQARNHLMANERKVPENLIEQLEAQLCLTLPPGWCNYDDPNRVRPQITMTWDDIKAGLTTFSTWIAGRCGYVPQAEAERRAEICARCYLNLPVSGCAACHAAVELVTANKHTKADYLLKGCGACKCLLKAKVHFPISILDKANPGVQALYPDFCWAKKDGQNFISG